MRRRAGGAAAVTLALVAVTGCGGGKAAVRPEAPVEHTPVPVTRQAAEAALGPPEGVESVLDQARAHLGKDRVRVKGKSFRYDCSGFVRGMYSALGIDVMSGGGSEDDNGVRLIHHYVDKHGQNHSRAVPNTGDIVYFDNTWDKNGNGKLDDPLTHVGLVEEVRADGTVIVIHRANRGIVRDPMNLLRPHDLKDEHDHEVNAYLRPKGRKEPTGIPHTMAELWAGFGTVEVSRAVSDGSPAQGPTPDRMLMLAEIGADCGCEE